MTFTWDDRKAEMEGAIAAGDMQTVRDLVGKMQSEIDYAGGRLIDALEARQICEQSRVDQFIRLYELDPQTRLGDRTRLEWTVQFQTGVDSPWQDGRWERQTSTEAWARFCEDVRTIVPEHKKFVRLVYRVVTDPIPWR